MTLLRCRHLTGARIKTPCGTGLCSAAGHTRSNPRGSVFGGGGGVAADGGRRCSISDRSMNDVASVGAKSVRGLSGGLTAFD